jgi:hypothetical protein
MEEKEEELRLAAAIVANTPIRRLRSHETDEDE